MTDTTNENLPANNDNLDKVFDETDQWDIVEVLRDGSQIKIAIKEMTVRDGLKHEQYKLQLLEQMGKQQKNLEDDLPFMLLIQNWPLIRFGTKATEGVDIPQTKDEFFELPEYVMLQWAEAVREVNPQYSIPFADVWKTLRDLRLQNKND